MFIKIEIEENPPVFYRFQQNELLLGSSSNNSIVINHKSVSKKHLKLSLDNGKWYAVDQGSTNGSYLDEEQLIPGKRVEVGIDAVLKLGPYTTVSFVENADESIEVNQVEISSVATSISSDSDRTRVLTAADLQAAKAAADKKKKEELLLKRAKELKIKNEERKKLYKQIGFCLIIICVGLAANKWWQRKVLQEKKNTIIKKMQNKFLGDMEIDLDLEGFRIPRKNLLYEKELQMHLKGILCRQPDALDLCRIENVYGAKILKSSKFLIFLNETKFSLDAKILLPEGSGDEEIRKTIGLKFILNYFRGSTFPPESEVYLVIFDDPLKNVTGVIALKASSLSMLLSEAKSEDLIVKNAKKLESYYTYYPEKTQPRSQSQAIEEKSNSHSEVEDP
jgi:pSer/pThr/pTyr-binding forkhead associated (FHA) protein